MKEDYFVSAEWPHDNLTNKAIKIIEVPWKKDAYGRAHIPGARCLNRHSYLKKEDKFGKPLIDVFDETECKQMFEDMGIDANDEIIVYDDFNGLFACRFWWVCSYFGFDNVKILDGGWLAWVQKEYPISTRIPDYV